MFVVNQLQISAAYKSEVETKNVLMCNFFVGNN